MVGNFSEETKLKATYAARQRSELEFAHGLKIWAKPFVIGKGGNVQSWSLILFGYNEASSANQVILNTLKVAEQLTSDFELILVDDGSTDATQKITKEWAEKDSRIHLLRHSSNRGIGTALRAGYSVATKENVCALPMDGQFDPAELLPFAEFPPQQVICFCRYGRPGYSPYRKGLSHINRTLNQVVFGLRLDDVNWVKAYKRADLHSLGLKITSSLVESEICAKLTKSGCRFVEVPSRYLPRVGGKASGASAQQLLRTAKDTWQLVRVVKRWKPKARKVKG